MNTMPPPVSSENAGLPAERLAVLRECLEEQRRFRLEQLGEQLRGPGAGPGGGRAAGAGQAGVRRQLLDSARMVLADVEDALGRMEGGRYGSCELCGLPLPLDRLAIVPQARYCLHCQQVREDIG